MTGGHHALRAIGALAGLILGLGVLPALAQTSASVTATATVTIVEPFSITVVADLSFGGLEVETVPGTVILNRDGTRQATGGVRLLGGASFHPAEFTVTGGLGANYIIGFPAFPTATVEKSKSDPVFGENSLPISAFDAETGEGPGNSGHLDPITGTDTILLGGTLDVPITAESGNYRGDIELTITFL